MFVYGCKCVYVHECMCVLVQETIHVRACVEVTEHVQVHV